MASPINYYIAFINISSPITVYSSFFCIILHRICSPSVSQHPKTSPPFSHILSTYLSFPHYRPTFWSPIHSDVISLPSLSPCYPIPFPTPLLFDKHSHPMRPLFLHFLPIHTIISQFSLSPLSLYLLQTHELFLLYPIISLCLPTSPHIATP